MTRIRRPRTPAPPARDDPFRALFERSVAGMILTDLDGKVLSANDAACRLSGRELIGTSVLDLVHRDDRPGLVAEMRGFIERGAEQLRLERRFIRPDDSVVWAEVLTRVVRAEDDTPLYLESVLIDITDRQVRFGLDAVVDASPDAIVATTLDDRIVSWNAGAERIFGYSAAEMVGRSAAVLRGAESERDVPRLMQRIRRGETVEHRVVRTRKDGSTVTLLAWSTPIVDAHRAVIGTATVARDLGEHERSDAMFRSLLEAAPDAMVCVDESGVIAFVNAQAEELFGYTRDELIGREVEILVPGSVRHLHPAHRHRYTADPLARPMGAGQQLAGRRKDGTEFPAEISLSAIPTEQGPLISAAIRDGTERRQAAIVASSSDAIISRDLNGTITSWNGGAERMYGYTAAEAIGTDLARMIPPGRSDELPELIDRVRRRETVEHYDTQRIRKDGAQIDVSVTLSPVRDAAGLLIGTSAVARDVTESRRAVDALRALEARKSAILESALDSFITMDHNGRVVEFNPAAERLFGYTRAQVVGQPLAEMIIPAALREAHVTGLARYLETGDGRVLGQRVELTAMRADGSELPVELAITRVDLPGPPLFTAYLRDISDRKQIEEERKALGERLRQSERLDSLGQMAGGVAHDFNNLLGAIMSYAELVAMRIEDDEQARADIEQIRAAAQRGARLTRQLLIVGRREPIRREVIVLNAIIADLRDLLRRSVGEQVELVIRSTPDLPAIRADRGQIEQVILNLTLNARDAMPRGGTITIATRVVDVDDDFIRLHPDAMPGLHVELGISDTGVGIAPEVTDHVFEPFFTTKPKGRGTGLGLATVYSIVTEAGGSLSVYSEVGMGTTFRVLLPVAGETADRAPAVVADDLNGHGETVLVVEDEPAMMEVTRRILRRSGYNVVEAANGEAALEVATDPELRLLLTDLVMPQMSGHELAEHIHAMRPELPVLFMSGYDEAAIGDGRIIGEGAAFLQKPFNARTLLEQVRAALSRPSE